MARIIFDTQANKNNNQTTGVENAPKKRDIMSYQALELRLEESLQDLKMGTVEWIMQRGLIEKVLIVNTFCKDFAKSPDYGEILDIIEACDERQRAISDMKFDQYRELCGGMADGATLGIAMKAWKAAEPGSDLWDDMRAALEEVRNDQHSELSRFNEGAVKYVWRGLFAIKALDTWSHKEDYPHEKAPWISMGEAAATLSVLASNV